MYLAEDLSQNSLLVLIIHYANVCISMWNTVLNSSPTYTVLYIQWNLRIHAGHIGDNINSAVVSFVEVNYTLSLFRRVHYQRFHCTTKKSVTVYSE